MFLLFENTTWFVDCQYRYVVAKYALENATGKWMTQAQKLTGNQFIALPQRTKPE